MTYNALVFYSPVTVGMEAMHRMWHSPVSRVAIKTHGTMDGRVRYRQHGPVMTTLDVDDADQYHLNWACGETAERNHDV